MCTSGLHFPLSGVNFPLSGVNFTNFTSSWLLLGAPGSFKKSLRALESILSPQTRLSGAPARARARGDRPASKLVPGDFWEPRTVKITQKSIFSAQNPSETLCNLPRALWKLSGKLSGAQAPARAETGRPQNWSPAFFVHLQ